MTVFRLVPQTLGTAHRLRLTHSLPPYDILSGTASGVGAITAAGSSNIDSLSGVAAGLGISTGTLLNRINLFGAGSGIGQASGNDLLTQYLSGTAAGTGSSTGTEWFGFTIGAASSGDFLFIGYMENPNIQGEPPFGTLSNKICSDPNVILDAFYYSTSASMSYVSVRGSNRIAATANINTLSIAGHGTFTLTWTDNGTYSTAQFSFPLAASTSYTCEFISSVVNVSGAASGAGAVTGATVDALSISGTAAGTGTVTGSQTGIAALSGTAAGTGAAAGIIQEQLAIAGTAAGAGAVTGAASAAISIAATGAGVGAVAGAIQQSLFESGTAIGTGAATAAATAILSIAGTAAGQGTSAATTAAISGPVYQTSFLSGPLDSAISLSRASTGDYFNTSGVISSAAINTARFDNSASTFSAVGLLTEEQRTNMLTQSSYLSDSSWTSTNNTRTQNAATAPDGSASAARIVPLAISSAHNVTKSPAVTLHSIYTFSVWAKASGYNYAYVHVLVDNSSASYGVVVDLTTGSITQTKTAGTPFGTPSAIVTLGSNGWVQIAITFAANNTTVQTSVSPLPTSTAASFNATGDAVFTGVNPNGTYFWGAQVELGAFATSYIPTTTAAVTRSADVLGSNSTLSTYLANGPSIIESTDLATGTTSRTAYAAGAFTWPQNKWLRSMAVYASGTDTSTHMTVGSAY